MEGVKKKIKNGFQCIGPPFIDNLLYFFQEKIFFSPSSVDELSYVSTIHLKMTS